MAEEGEQLIITIRRAQVEELLAHARAVAPAECCGLVGGRANAAQTVYRLQNVAADARVAYEGDPRELCEAQRQMRERGEQLLAIYHSHPRETRPAPSETDVRLAYHPGAVYLIIGFAGESSDERTSGGRAVDGATASLHAFRIFRSEKRWERVEYRLAES